MASEPAWMTPKCMRTILYIFAANTQTDPLHHSSDTRANGLNSWRARVDKAWLHRQLSDHLRSRLSVAHDTLSRLAVNQNRSIKDLRSLSESVHARGIDIDLLFPLLFCSMCMMSEGELIFSPEFVNPNIISSSIKDIWPPSHPRVTPAHPSTLDMSFLSLIQDMALTHPVYGFLPLIQDRAPSLLFKIWALSPTRDTNSLSSRTWAYYSTQNTINRNESHQSSNRESTSSTSSTRSPRDLHAISTRLPDVDPKVKTI